MKMRLFLLTACALSAAALSACDNADEGASTLPPAEEMTVTAPAPGAAPHDAIAQTAEIIAADPALAVQEELAENQSSVPADAKISYEMAGVVDPQTVTAFVMDLQNAVARNEPAAVASLVRYPLVMYKDGTETARYNTPADLIAAYDSVFTEKVKAAIQAAKITDLFVNMDGIMIGDGAVWFDGWALDQAMGGPVQITAVNP